MTKYNKFKKIIKLGLVGSLVTSFLTFSVTANDIKNVKHQEVNTEKKIVEIKNSINQDDKAKNELTTVIGARRYELMIDNDKDIDLNNLHDQIKNLVFKNNDYLLKSDILSNLKIITFAISNHADINLLNEKLELLLNKNEDIKDIYFFNTKYTYTDFVNKKLPDVETVSNSFTRKRYDYNDATTYDAANQHHYKIVGLDYFNQKTHFEHFFNEKVTIGLLDGDGVVRHNSKPFRWNNDNGNGVHWRDEPFYTEVSSDHSDQIGEIMVGQKGINQTAKLWSVMIDLYWNGVTGEVNFLLSRGVNIIVNVWNFKDHIDKEYAGYSKYFDQVVVNNPEIINVIAGGNISPHSDYQSRYLNGIALSKNSIIVGAIDSYTKKKAYYSKIGRDDHYLTVVAPSGAFHFSNPEWQTWGTSNSAGVIAGLLSIIYQKNKPIFNRGHDSIIAKSALISGSLIPPSEEDTYTHQTGYGIPRLDLVDQAVKNLRYFKNMKNDDKKVVLILKKGDRVRVNATWNYKNYSNNDKADVDLRVIGKENYSSTSSDRNTETIDFVVKTSGNYIIKLNVYNKSSNISPVDVAITYVIEKGNV